MPVRTYVYDGEAVLQEADGAGVTQVTYTRTGGGYGDLLSQYDGPAADYYEPDGLGSTDALADNTQTVTDRWAYRAFGAAVHASGSDPTPFTWVGRLGYISDSQTGLYLLGSGTRHYDPATAQFLSRDRIEFTSDDTNLYRYVANRPVNTAEPAGGKDKKDCVRPVGGTWTTHGGGTQQAVRRFAESFRCCGIRCTGRCEIRIRAFRVFHSSVAPGDSRDPCKFETIFQITFVRTNRVCNGVKIPDSTFYLNPACRLYPGRLISANAQAEAYAATLKSCADFDSDAFCKQAAKIDPLFPPKK